MRTFNAWVKGSNPIIFTAKHHNAPRATETTSLLKYKDAFPWKSLGTLYLLSLSFARNYATQFVVAYYLSVSHVSNKHTLFIRMLFEDVAKHKIASRNFCWTSFNDRNAFSARAVTQL